MRALQRLLLVLGLACVGSGADAAAAPGPLTEVGVIALKGVVRRIDHLALDPTSKRLFVAALGNRTLEVLDVAHEQRITSIAGLKEPQGVAYLPRTHRIVVAMRGGSVAAFDDASYQRIATIDNLGDADNLRYDAAADQLYVGYGSGALGLIDPASTQIVAKIPLNAHPESFRLEQRGPRIFVNLPESHEIAVVDRQKRAVVQHIPLGHLTNNYPMSLDEDGQRLFVAVRQPAKLLVFDTQSGKSLLEVPCVGDSDDLYYDARRQRVYVIGGEGYVDVFDAASSKFERIARIATRAGARTGLWSSELDRLFVAWPSRNGQPAEIQILSAPASP
jgi:DNA-binding beta-propeller fold protein YncE